MYLEHELDIQELTKIDKLIARTAEGLYEIITRNNHFARDRGGRLYVYRNGVYHSCGNDAVELAVAQILEATQIKWTSHRSKEAKHYITVHAPLLLERPEINRLNVRNGIYNLSTKTLEPHDPEYRTTVQLNVEYDPNAICPAWDKFINEVFPDDEPELSKRLGYEIGAWLMVPITEDQKAVVCLGEGANGKSIYIECLEEFLGKDNTCNVSLQKLSERFTSTLLIGKLANISPDLSGDRIASTGEFKALTGGDSLAAEYKHGGQFKFTPFARCLFGCNSFPVSPDTSDGFYRRFNIIHFGHKFADNADVRRVIVSNLKSETEKSGYLNKCLEMVDRVIAHGISRTSAMLEAAIQHQKENDPLFEWLGERTINEGHIAKEELFLAYRQSGNVGKAARSQVSFGRDLKRYRPNVESKQIKIGNGVAWCFDGIRLRNDIDDVDWSNNEADLDLLDLNETSEDGGADEIIGALGIEDEGEMSYEVLQ